jgi:hypothetical protein
MQNGNKGRNHDRHPRVELGTAITPGKWRNAQEDPIWDFQREDRETSSRNFQWVKEKHGLDLVEGLAPSKAEKETVLT